jgi:hypothetical protein
MLLLQLSGGTPFRVLFQRRVLFWVPSALEREGVVMGVKGLLLLLGRCTGGLLALLSQGFGLLSARNAADGLLALDEQAATDLASLNGV